MIYPATRPQIPYDNVSSPYDQRYTLLASAPNPEPPSAYMFDGDLNKAYDYISDLYTITQSIVAGSIPGSDNIANANKLLTTDGESNLSWISIGSSNLDNFSITTSKYALQSIGSDQIMDGTLTGDKIAQNTIRGGNTGNIALGAIEGINIDPTANITINDLVTTGIIHCEDDLTVDGNINASNYVGTWNGGTIGVPKGGTGLTTLTTSYGVLCAGTSPTGSIQNAGTGTVNQVLISGGAASLGTWRLINTANVMNNAITTPLINNNAITTPLINNGAVTNVKLGNDVIPLTAAAKINANGSIAKNMGISTVTNPGTGTYQIVFNNAMSGSNYIIHTTAIDDYWVIYVTAQSAAGCTLQMVRTSNGTPVNGKFFVSFFDI